MADSVMKFMVIEETIIRDCIDPDEDPIHLEQGSIVYKCILPDYGLARDDTMMSGQPYVSVTLDPDGGYPFFTILRERLRVLDTNVLH